MTKQNNQNSQKMELQAQKQALDKRLESFAWALFFVMSGILWIMPKELVPEGGWLIGTGLIILGFSGIRYLYRIKIEGFWLVMGIIFLSFGLSEYFRVELPLFPILIILIGMSIIYKAFFSKTRKGEAFEKFGEFCRRKK